MKFAFNEGKIYMKLFNKMQFQHVFSIFDKIISLQITFFSAFSLLIQDSYAYDLSHFLGVKLSTITKLT